MKNNVFILALIALFGFGLSSCNKCVTCESCDEGVTFINSNGTESIDAEICENDAANKDDYNSAIADYESYGCTCN